MQRFRRTAITFAFAAAACAAGAQTYPSKPLRLIVPFAPGGGTDTISRVVAQKLTEQLGQLVIVENRPDAGGLIGTESAFKLPADGYTLVTGTISALAIIPITQSKPSYDPQKDFTPVSMTATGPYVLVAHPSLPARTVGELVKLARGNPSGIIYGSTGFATGTHLTAEYFSSVTGVKMSHVPYKGDALAVIDLISGQISLGFFTPIVMSQHIRAGRLRAIAVTALARTRGLPQVPTVAESGYPGFEAGSWMGVIVRAVTDPEVSATIEVQGNTPAAGPPEVYERYIAAEIVKWRRVIAEAAIKID